MSFFMSFSLLLLQMQLVDQIQVIEKE